MNRAAVLGGFNKPLAPVERSSVCLSLAPRPLARRTVRLSNLSAIYKLVELDISGIKRFTAKFSEEKATLPGGKQIFRYPERDVLARSGECGAGKPLVRPVVLNGELVEPLPDLAAARAYAAESLAALPERLRSLDGAEEP